MEKTRKTKVIAILALIVAVVGMSLGFAAFSNTLTISSSATVTPNEEDFKMVVYGIGEDVNIDCLTGSADESLNCIPTDASLYTSLISSKPVLYGNSENRNENFVALSSTIKYENNTVNVSNAQINFTDPGQGGYYLFLIKNEGKYDAYINFSDYENWYTNSDFKKSCIAGSGATESLVENACNNIFFHPGVFEADSNAIILTDFTSSYKVAPGDYVRGGVHISYSGIDRADGPFSVVFQDFAIQFTSAPKGEVINP